MLALYTSPLSLKQSATALVVFILGGWQAAHSGNLYIYRDNSGTTLLTNHKVSSGSYRQQRVTYYPDSNIHSYRNWGKTEAAVPASTSRAKNAFDQIIQSAAQAYGVSAGLIKAVMHTESGFNTMARSPVGAQGLMQLMPATARRFSVTNAYDPQQNIHGGARYLSFLLKRFNNNVSLALAAYNAGEGNVDKYGGIPPFRETQDYVRRVTSRYQNLYSGGLSLSTAANDTKIVASSSGYTTPPSPRREIVYNNGAYTDRALRRTYVNDNAITSSRIDIHTE